ncbi:MAG: phosphoribosyltransferase [Candidatus Bathyarchaeota archaeon]|nr:MAG: phosphoribosyltransferase [Candidatus Bathyarchaeota archaeon]
MSLTGKVAGQIREGGYIPDVIVAISRGGFVPARVLSDYLGRRRLASIQIEYYTGVGSKTREPRVVYPLNADVSGLRVLLVDDVSDTGVTLKVAKEHVENRGPEVVQVVTLHVKPWTSYRPDYTATEVEEWIVYPWESLESVRSMAGRLLKSGLNPLEVKYKLLELGFDPETVERRV